MPAVPLIGCLELVLRPSALLAQKVPSIMKNSLQAQFLVVTCLKIKVHSHVHVIICDDCCVRAHQARFI